LDSKRLINSQHRTVSCGVTQNELSSTADLLHTSCRPLADLLQTSCRPLADDANCVSHRTAQCALSVCSLGSQLVGLYSVSVRWTD